MPKVCRAAHNCIIEQPVRLESAISLKTQASHPFRRQFSMYFPASFAETCLSRPCPAACKSRGTFQKLTQSTEFTFVTQRDRPLPRTRLECTPGAWDSRDWGVSRRAGRHAGSPGERRCATALIILPAPCRKSVSRSTVACPCLQAASSSDIPAPKSLIADHRALVRAS